MHGSMSAGGGSLKYEHLVQCGGRALVVILVYPVVLHQVDHPSLPRFTTNSHISPDKLTGYWTEATVRGKHTLVEAYCTEVPTLCSLLPHGAIFQAKLSVAQYLSNIGDMLRSGDKYIVGRDTNPLMGL